MSIVGHYEKRLCVGSQARAALIRERCQAVQLGGTAVQDLSPQYCGDCILELFNFDIDVHRSSQYSEKVPSACRKCLNIVTHRPTVLRIVVDHTTCYENSVDKHWKYVPFPNFVK